MIEMLKIWYERHFSNPQVLILAILLLTVFGVVIFMGNMLLPLLASIVIAYLLEEGVLRIERRGFSRVISAVFVYLCFVCLMVVAAIGMLPLLSEQITQFIGELPKMLLRVQKALLELPQAYPGYVNEAQIKELMVKVGSELGSYGQHVLQLSLSSLKGLLTWAVYLILILLLVFFFLKDKKKIVSWLTMFLPDERVLVAQVWAEMDDQIGNYVRGKVLEIIIIGVCSWIVFAVMGLNYAALLGLLVGLSVLVPYVGATVVTVPVAMVAFFQWGWGSEFAYLMLAYGIVQALDGNVLVPLLFSEAVNLHPVAIIIAIIVFGGFWGFWGVFFAIPLATLVKAVLNAWPTAPEPNLPRDKQAGH